MKETEIYVNVSFFFLKVGYVSWFHLLGSGLPRVRGGRPAGLRNQSPSPGQYSCEFSLQA